MSLLLNKQIGKCRVAEHCRCKLYNLIVGNAIDVERILNNDGNHGLTIVGLYHYHTANA